jgi:hypothetical protein
MLKLAVIVPYRDRCLHLEVFRRALNYYLRNYHPEINYFVLIVEQNLSTQPFNRGKLFNVGYHFAKCNYSFDYVCLHDVDLIPERVDYTIPEYPMHLAAFIEERNYQLPYAKFFGGVNLILNKYFEKINGFCNTYWGWGAEDDDLRLRFEKTGFEIKRRSGYFASLPHLKDYDRDLKSKNLITMNAAKYYNKKHQSLKELIQSGLSDVSYSKEKFENLSHKFKLLTVNI